jgi:hypothetical protein
MEGKYYVYYENRMYPVKDMKEIVKMVRDPRWLKISSSYNQCKDFPNIPQGNFNVYIGYWDDCGIEGFEKPMSEMIQTSFFGSQTFIGDGKDILLGKNLSPDDMKKKYFIAFEDKLIPFNSESEFLTTLIDGANRNLLVN